MTTHKEKRAQKRAAAAIAAGLVPHPADVAAMPVQTPAEFIDNLEVLSEDRLPATQRNRALSRRMYLLLAAARLSYRTSLVSVLSQYRAALVGALEHFGTGWDARALAVEAHYLTLLPRAVGNVFDQLWPKLVTALEEQAKAQGLHPQVPDKAPWRAESVRLMDKSARELGMDMRRGEGADDIGVGRAAVIADDQLGKLAAAANQASQRAAGVGAFVWSGMMDEKERPEHVALEGRVFPWTTDHFLPGEEVNCRCVAIVVRH